MGIDLQWESERGEVHARISDERGLVSKIIAAHPSHDESACLRFIDLYGDTVFNRLQIPVFLDELDAVPDLLLSAEEQEHREKIAELARKAENEVGTYLKFYGD